MKRFNIFCLLDNNGYDHLDTSFETILAAGENARFTLEGTNGLTQLQQFYDAHRGWLFGHFSYDALTENNKHKRPDIDFGKASFFIPSIIIKLEKTQLTVITDDFECDHIFSEISAQPSSLTPRLTQQVSAIQSMPKSAYLEAIEKIRQHIHRGDCYELNYCQQFSAKQAVLDPVYVYKELSGISPNPFAALYKLDDNYCICASPERFLKKTGDTLIAQPIKGTSRRIVNDPETDRVNREYLLSSKKERAENVMIVDLVRNDLSRICKEGSVEVEELFGIYAFPQVYQMISTVKGKVEENIDWTTIIEACFPMGSMTGAPKQKVIELIEQYEPVPRGLFSGSIGYIDPQGDFDFNVVIRSIFYSAGHHKLDYFTGGGITFNSIPVKEYEESLLKGEAIAQVLKN